MEYDYSAKLCYVKGDWAWFTTASLNEQWGDDWNDAPYEHNAGTPYEYAVRHAERGEKPWLVYRVAWLADLETPADKYRFGNSPWSVEEINDGDVPWLSSPSYEKHQVTIMAGTMLADFINIVREIGGEVYLLTDAAPAPAKEDK